MKAWRVTVPQYFPDHAAVVAAATPGRARAQQMRLAQAAGWKIDMRHMRSRRAPEYDALACQHEVTTVLGWRAGDGAGYGVLAEAACRD